MKTIWAKIRKYKTWLIALLIIAIGTGAGMYFYSGTKKTNAAPEQTAKVERGDVSSIVSATGSVEPVNSVDISSKITAQIKEVKVKENDLVTAGQVLVVLKDDDLQPQLVQAEEKVTNAAANYQRNLRLNKIGAVPDQQLETSLMDYNIAQANYNQVLSNLKETVITAPIDGTVIGEPLPAGQMVAQGVNNPTVILTVADMSKMQIDAQVDQTDIGKVQVGQRTTFTVDAYPDRKFTGTVSNISQKATVSQNVTYYTVKIDVDSTENVLKPSMVARVSIAIGESPNALTLPLSAIRSNKDGSKYVVERQNGQTVNVPVITGLMGDDRVEVTSGVSEGDIVILPTVTSSATNSSSGQRSGQSGPPIRL